MLLPTRPALHYLSNLLHLLPREAALFVADGVGDPRRVWLRVGDTLRRARRAQTQCHLVRWLSFLRKCYLARLLSSRTCSEDITRWDYYIYDVIYSAFNHIFQDNMTWWDYCKRPHCCTHKKIQSLSCPPPRVPSHRFFLVRPLSRAPSPTLFRDQVSKRVGTPTHSENPDD